MSAREGALRLLLVEDDPVDARLLLLELERGGLRVDVTRVDEEAGYTWLRCRARRTSSCATGTCRASTR